MRRIGISGGLKTSWRRNDARDEASKDTLEEEGEGVGGYLNRPDPKIDNFIVILA